MLQMMKFWAQILLWHLQFVLVIVYWVFYHGTFYKVNTGHDIIILDLSSTGQCVLLVLTFGIPTVLMKLNTKKCIWCTQSLLVSLIFIATAI